jgi:hypothetical protein
MLRKWLDEISMGRVFVWLVIAGAIPCSVALGGEPKRSADRSINFPLHARPLAWFFVRCLRAVVHRPQPARLSVQVPRFVQLHAQMHQHGHWRVDQIGLFGQAASSR